MKRIIVFWTVLIVVVGFELSPRCWAQFPGDLFFERPTVTTPQGSMAEMNVQFFAGAEVFGAAMFDVVFDAREVRIEEVTLRGTVQSPTVRYTRERDGKVAIAVYNDASLGGPLGTINVVTLVVRPLVAAGRSAVITLRPREALNTAGVSFPLRSAFGGVLVVGAGSAIQSLVSVGHDEGSVTVAGPLAVNGTEGEVVLGRAGGIFDWWEEAGAGDGPSGWKTVRVQTFDPAAPSDAAKVSE